MEGFHRATHIYWYHCHVVNATVLALKYYMSSRQSISYKCIVILLNQLCINNLLSFVVVIYKHMFITYAQVAFEVVYILFPLFEIELHYP